MLPAAGTEDIGAGKGVRDLGRVGNIAVVLFCGNLNHPSKPHLKGQRSHGFHGFLGGVSRNQDIGGSGKNTGIAGGETTLLFSRHGVTCHKLIGRAPGSLFIAGKRFHRLADLSFDAAGVGENAPGFQPFSILPDKRQNIFRIHGKIHQVGRLHVG